LRRAFARWGRPERVRVDNGTPWGSKGDLPTDLALWLIGLGVDLVWNQPRRPQENGVVERAQGTGKRWGEPHTCDSPRQLQARFTDLDRVQREDYPYAAGRSRQEVFPGLRHSGRAYRPDREAGLWNLDRVAEHLADYAVPRRVDRKGQVSLYNRNYYLGVIHRDTTVHVMFDAASREWVFAAAQGQQVRRVAAVEIDRERIVGLQVTHRRERSQTRAGNRSGGTKARQN
jgi:hypothetical protein